MYTASKRSRAISSASRSAAASAATMNSPSRCADVERRDAQVVRVALDAAQALTTIDLRHARRRHLLEQAVHRAGPIAQPVRFPAPVAVGGKRDRPAARASTGGVSAAATRSIAWSRPRRPGPAPRRADRDRAAPPGTSLRVRLAQQRADQVAAAVEIGRDDDQLAEPGLPQALDQHLGVAAAERVGLGGGVAGGRCREAAARRSARQRPARRRGIERRAQHATTRRAAAVGAPRPPRGPAPRPPAPAAPARHDHDHRRGAARTSAAARRRKARLQPAGVGCRPATCRSRCPRCRAGSRADRRRGPWRRPAAAAPRAPPAAPRRATRPTDRRLPAVELARPRAAPHAVGVPAGAPGRRSPPARRWPRRRRGRPPDPP